MVLCLAGCVMTADENLWKDLGHDLSGDLGGEQTLDAPTPDAPTLDAPTLDAPTLDMLPDIAPDSLTPVDAKLPPDSTCLQTVLKVAAAADDGIIWGTEWSPDGYNQDLWIGYWDAKSEWVYLRFALNKAVPKGAKIVSATLSLHGGAEDNWNQSSNAIEVWAEKTANAPAVTKASDAPYTPSGRPLTTATVRWPVSGALKWIVNSYNTTPNLAPLFQELVTSQGSLATGNHLQLWMRGAQTTQADVATPDFKTAGYNSHPATLTINWCQ